MMKKNAGVLIFFLIFALFTFAGCGSGGGDTSSPVSQSSQNQATLSNSQNQPAPAPTPTPAPTTAPVPGPVVSDVQPSTLKPGDVCAITGSGFGAVRGPEALRAVLFGGVPSTAYVMWSDTRIQCTVPENAPGGLIPVNVRIDTGTEVFSSIDFLVTIESNTADPSSLEKYVFLSSFGSSGAPTRAVRAAPTGALNTPTGMAKDSSGNIYVADGGNNRVQEFTWNSVTGAYEYTAGWGIVGNGGTVGTTDIQFNIPYAVAVDSEGNIYATDMLNNRVQKFNSSGTLLAMWGQRGTGNGQFYWPSGIAVDSGNNIYVADTANNRIQKFNSSGGWLATWGGTAPGTGDGQFNWPMGIAADSSGASGATQYIYVSDTYNNRIQKFAPDGAFQAKWGSAGSSDSSFSTPRGITVDIGNTVYVADTGNNRIQKFTPGGQFILKWGTSGTGNNNFKSPYGIVTCADNTLGERIHVADTLNNRIETFRPDISLITSWSTTVSGETGSTPMSVAVDSTNGSVYVTDILNHGSYRQVYYVKKYTSSGVYQARSRGGGNSSRSPYGVGLDSSNNVYVAYYGTRNNNGGLYKGDPDLVSLTSFISSKNIKRPKGVSLDSSGNIYVANTGAPAARNRIRKFTSSGTPITTTWTPTVTSPPDIAVAYETGYTYPVVYVVDNGTPKSVKKYTTTNGTAYALAVTIGAGRLNTPMGIGIDSFGFLYVADNGTTKCLWKFASNGTFMAQLTSWSAGAFDTPNDVCGKFLSSSTPPENLYVTDAGSQDRILKFQPTYSYQTEYGDYGSGPGQFKNPTGIVAHTRYVSQDLYDSEAYVVDRYNHRIEKFVSTNYQNYSYSAQWGSEGQGVSQFEYPFGISLYYDSAATARYLYVVDTGNNRILKFDSTGTPQATTWSGSTFNTPTTIALSADATTAYVADCYNHRVKKFTSADRQTYIYAGEMGTGGYGQGNGQFRYPYGVAVDSGNCVYVADSDNNRIQKFNGSTGGWMATWTTFNSGQTFNTPMGISVDTSDNVLVADTGNNRMVRLRSDGTFRGIIGLGLGNDNQHFYLPYSSCFDGYWYVNNGSNYCNTFITDTYNHVVKVWGMLPLP